MEPHDDRMRAVLPRFFPQAPFPAYTYVPGETPHPSRDPRGHLFGLQAEPLRVSPEPWFRCDEYLRGVDLFNHGYYWESHEAWEAVWHATGRAGPTADLLKGLIKLAAGGVKTRAGSPIGRQRHCRRAAELFQRACGGDGGTEVRRRMGLSLDRLIRWAEEAGRDVVLSTGCGSCPPRVFSFVLLPADRPE